MCRANCLSRHLPLKNRKSRKPLIGNEILKIANPPVIYRRMIHIGDDAVPKREPSLAGSGIGLCRVYLCRYESIWGSSQVSRTPRWLFVTSYSLQSSSRQIAFAILASRPTSSAVRSISLARTPLLARVTLQLLSLFLASLGIVPATIIGNDLVSFGWSPGI
jgi:hypothetical protein